MKLVRVDGYVFVTVESECAYVHMRTTAEGEKKAGMEGISNRL